MVNDEVPASVFSGAEAQEVYFFPAPNTLGIDKKT
jgi:hypothetical protein